MSCLVIGNQEQGPVLPQDKVKEDPLSPSQQIQDWAAGTDHVDAGRAETRSVSSDQAGNGFPEEWHVHVSDITISGPAPYTLDQPHRVVTTSSELAHQAASLASSDHRQSVHNTLSTVLTPMPSNRSLVSWESTLPCPPPLRIFESLGLEGCAGIFGGFVGILGSLDFLPSSGSGVGNHILHFNSPYFYILTISKRDQPLKLATPRGFGGSWRYATGCLGP